MNRLLGRAHVLKYPQKSPLCPQNSTFGDITLTSFEDIEDIEDIGHKSLKANFYTYSLYKLLNERLTKVRLFSIHMGYPLNIPNILKSPLGGVS